MCPCFWHARGHARLHPRYEERRRVPLRLPSLARVLNPQPSAARVLHGLLDWIARADAAAQQGDAKPDARRLDGEPLFPPDDPWWLTDLERRSPDVAAAPDDSGEAKFDEDDLTFHAEGAGVESSSDDDSDGTASESSLPAGAAPSCGHGGLRPLTPATFAALQAPPPRRRLRGKQPAADFLPQVATSQPPLAADDGPGRAEQLSTPRVDDVQEPEQVSEEPQPDVREVLRDVLLDVATINVRWQPWSQVFTFPIDEATTVLEFKHCLSREVECEAHNMHLVFGTAQLLDDVPLCQYVGHGDTVIGKPKRGG